MSYIDGNDLVFYGDSDKQIYSGGFSVNSIMMKSGISPFTTLISTSFFKGEIPIAWRVTEPNIEITIPAGTPVTALIPISLTDLNNSEMNERPMSDIPNNFWPTEEHTKVIREMNMKGIWSNFYRDAVDYLGNSVGNHEVKAIRLKINEINKND